MVSGRQFSASHLLENSVYRDTIWFTNEPAMEQSAYDRTGQPSEPPLQEVDGADVYRLLNPYSGEHLYTTDFGEVVRSGGAGWLCEGRGWTAPASAGRGTAPVYRLYNPWNGDHHYTMSLTEYNKLGSNGWCKEGPVWQSAAKSGSKVYRLWNPHQLGAGSHHYTMDMTEYGKLQTAGWTQEGVCWYALY